MAGGPRPGTDALTRREFRLARRRRALRLQVTVVLAVAVLVVLAIGAAGLTRRAAAPAQTVVAVPEPTSAPTTQPAQTAPPTATPAQASAPAPAPAPAPTPAPSAADCYAVRDAGGGPIRRGEYGYAAHLDSDGDGLACEYLPRR